MVPQRECAIFSPRQIGSRALANAHSKQYSDVFFMFQRRKVAVRQVAWMNRGLRRCDALLVVPAYYALGILPV